MEPIQSCDQYECNIRNVANATAEIVSNRTLGTQLGLTPVQLNEIEEYPVHERKIRLVQAWFRLEPDPTWEKLVEALRAPLVREDMIASEIEKNYIIARRGSFTGSLTASDFSSPPSNPFSLSSGSSPSSSLISSAIKHGDVKANFILRKNTIAIKRHFSQFVMKIIEHLARNSVDREHFKDFLKDTYKESSDLDLEDLGSVFQYFIKNGYWDHIHHDFLSEAIEKFTDTSLRQAEREYQIKISGYLATEKISDYLAKQKDTLTQYQANNGKNKKRPSTARRRSEKEYRDKLSVMLDVKVGPKTLKYVEDIWKKLDFLNLPKIGVVLDCIIYNPSKRSKSEHDSLKFLAACRSDSPDINVIKGYLEQGDCDIDITEDDEFKWTPLMWACENNHFEIGRLLLKYQPQVNIQDKKEWSPLMLASRAGDLEIVQGIVALGAEIDKPTNKLWTPLMWAAQEGHAEVAKFLLKKGAQVDFPNENGWTPLMQASQEGHVDVVNILLDHKANANHQSNTTWCALMAAAKNKHPEVVMALLDLKRGAEVDIARNDGTTAFQVASYYKGNSAVVNVLIKHGANINHQNKDGMTALMLATSRGHLDIVQTLINQGADINKPHPETGWTAIFFTAKSGNMNVFKELFEHKAKLNMQGRMVAQVATYFKHPKIVKATDQANIDMSSTIAASIKQEAMVLDTVLREFDQRMHTPQITRDRKIAEYFPADFDSSGTPNFSESDSDTSPEPNPQEEHLKMFDELVKSTKKKIDLHYLKLYFIGLPGVGKTTFRKRLTRSLSNISSLPPEERRHFSTHLAECIQTLCIIKDESTLDLEVSENIEEELRALYKYLTHTETNTEVPTSNLGDTVSPQTEVSESSSNHSVTEIDTEHKSSDSEENKKEVVQPKTITSKFSRILADLRDIIASGNYENILSMHKVLINIIDIGGQPGFLEMLPFVCGGPGIFLVFFPLDKDFDQQYLVSYERNEHVITPYEAKYTIRETISQILAGIRCHAPGKCQSTENELQKRISRVKPTVSLVGTFKDKLELQVKQEVIQQLSLQSQFSEIPNEKIEKAASLWSGKLQTPRLTDLEKAIHKHLSSEFEKRMISVLENKHQSAREATSKSQIMYNPSNEKGLFEVDNYEGTDEDINPVRAHIQKCLKDDNRFVKVPVRPAQLLFGIILRKEYQIIKREECILIGNELKMTEADVDFTLWYFNQLGTLIYRSDIKNDDGWFKNNVICSPHIIFNSISELIIDPLLKIHSPDKASKPISQKECNDLSEKGQFSRETIERCLSSEINESELIPVEHLIKFLQHVHLLSPIRITHDGDESSEVYFMPAVLECASHEELSEFPTENTLAPLLIFFKDNSSSEIADFVPIGLFCAMIAKLVSDVYDCILGIKWELDDTCVKRNIVSFCVDGIYGVTLVSHATCYEIRISNYDESMDLHGIYTTIMITLNELTHDQCVSGFICPCDKHNSTKRILENCCTAVESTRMCAYKCSKTKNINLLDNPQHYPWLVKEILPNEEFFRLKAISSKSNFSFVWKKKGSHEVLSTANELLIEQVKSGDFYKCQIKKGDKVCCTTHHFLREALNKDTAIDRTLRSKRKMSITSNQASGEDAAINAPPRSKKRRMTISDRGEDVVLEPSCAGTKRKRKSDPDSPDESGCFKKQRVVKKIKTEKIDEVILMKIGKEIGDMWCEVGIALGMEFNELMNRIENDSKIPNHRKPLHMLHEWQSMAAECFTYKKLASALEVAGLSTCAHRYCYTESDAEDTK